MTLDKYGEAFDPAVPHRPIGLGEASFDNALARLLLKFVADQFGTIVHTWCAFERSEQTAPD